MNKPDATKLKKVVVVYDGDEITKQVPEGWELVEPDERITSDALIFYRGSGDIISNEYVQSPIDLWPSRKGGKIKEGDVFKEVLHEDDFWRLIKPIAPSKKSDQPDQEFVRLHNFFFPGMKMTDASKLPPPPKVIGRSWDEMAGD